MCSDRDPDPLNILESYIFRAKWHNYISTISKQDLSDSLTMMEVVVWGKVPWSLGQEGWRSQWFIFITHSWWVKVFCRWQTLFFGQKCDKELVGRAGGRTLLHVQLWYLFSSYKLPTTVTVTMLLLFGPVMLLCGNFSVFSWVRDLCSYQTSQTDTLPLRASGCSPIMRPWYYLHKLSHRGQCWILAQDPCMQMAV